MNVSRTWFCCNRSGGRCTKRLLSREYSIQIDEDARSWTEWKGAEREDFQMGNVIEYTSKFLLNCLTNFDSSILNSRNGPDVRGGSMPLHIVGLTIFCGCIWDNFVSKAVFRLRICPSSELQQSFLVTMEFAYSGVFSFPSYMKSVVNRSDCCNLPNGRVLKRNMASDVE